MPSIIIKGKVPSKKNSRRGFVRGNRIMNFASKSYMEWNHDAIWQLKGQPKIESNSITLKFWFENNRRTDLSNKAESIMDTLVDARLLEDDCWQVIGSLTLQSEGIDKENPRCEIIW